MSTLVNMLCARDHPVEVVLRPSGSLDLMKDAIDRGYVHIRFTDTRGGTELGVDLDRARSEISADILLREVGIVRLVGCLNLDYVAVRCIADIELPALRGRGRLELIAKAPTAP
jgi:hypothetical protein